MNGAIIGFGNIAIGHLAGYQQCADLSISSIVDISSHRRHIAKTCFGLSAYATFEQLLASQYIDFVDICTPPNTHATYSELALNGGFHTLCEKPVFLPDASSYQNQLAVINSSNKLFYPSHVYKFSPIITEVKKLVQAGKLGNIVRADFKTLRQGHALGVEGWIPDWRRNPSISKGGILRDHGPHSIYLATYLTDAIPLAVSCIHGSFSNRFKETEDTAFIRMKCTHEVDVSLTLSWSSSDRSTFYSLSGTKGSVMVNDDELTLAVGDNVVRKAIFSEFNDASHKNWFRDMFHDFKYLIAHPLKRPLLIKESLITSSVIDAAYLSGSRQGAWVDLSHEKYLMD